MADEPTAWQEINPTASARRHELASQCSAPADPVKVFRNELTACLALVAPVGMTEEAKRDWLAVAWATLKHLPPDVLTIGCQKARLSCDHPSKLVPAIIEGTREVMSWSRSGLEAIGPERQLSKPDYIKPEEASEILRQYGLKKIGGMA